MELEPPKGRAEGYHMDPTIIRSADPNPTPIRRSDPDRALVQAEGTQGLESHRRAPTLMAGAVPGGQGTVRVWAPQTWALVRSMVLLLGYYLAWIVYGVLELGMADPVSRVLGAILVAMCATGIALIPVEVLPAVLRRRYFTTDDAGIGITTWRRTRAFRWDEVVAYCEGRFGAPCMLYLSTGERIKLNLYGYPASTRAHLRTVIRSSTGLERVRGRSRARLPLHTIYARPGALIERSGISTRIRMPDQRSSVLRPPPANDPGAVRMLP